MLNAANFSITLEFARLHFPRVSKKLRDSLRQCRILQPSERKKMDTKSTCFVISPIGANASEERKRSDLVLKHIYKPALEPLGYAVIRADEISEPGSITLQVIERVLSSDLVIADLTDHNPNVFYELAVRHASEKPVIHVIATGQKIPFDIADMRTVSVDVDLEGAERSRHEISAQAKQIQAGHTGQTPVRLAGVLKHLESTKSEENIVLRQILDVVTESKTTTNAQSAVMYQQMDYMMKQIHHTIDRVHMNVDGLVRKQQEPGFWATLFEGFMNMHPVIARAQAVQSERKISFDEALRIAAAEEASKPVPRAPKKS